MAKKGHGLSLRQAAELFGLLADPSPLRIALLLARAGETVSGTLRALMGQPSRWSATI
jgi:hypothetical protein